VVNLMARLGGRGRHNGANAIVHLAREVVGRRRTLQNANQEVRNAVILDALADEDFRALDTTISERTTSDREFAQTLARLTYTAARAKGFDRCVVDAALRLDSLIPVDDPAHERDKLLRDAYSSAQKASYIRGGRLALGRLGRRAVESNDLERARVLLHQQLDLGPEKDDTPAEVDSALVLGDILRREGEHDQAQIYYRRAADAADRLDYRQGVAEALVRQIDSTPSSSLETVAALQHQALDAARRTGDRTLEARILVGLADTMLESNRTQDATGYFREALTIAEETGDLALEARCVTALATAYRELGQTLDAIEAERSALQIEERLGNRPAAAKWAVALGMSELDLRDPEAAVDAFERARLLGGQIGDIGIQQQAEGGLGVAYTLLRQGPETIDHLSRAIDLARRAHDVAHEAKWISSLGQAYWIFGQAEDATRTTAEAIDLAERTNDLPLQAELFTLLGQIYASQRETIRARECYTRALQLNRDLHQTAEQVTTLTALASLAADTGQYTQASQQFDQALGLAMSVDDRPAAVTIHGRIGSLARRRNDVRSALHHFEQAAEIAEALGDDRLANRALQHLATAQDVAGDSAAMSSYERAVNAADAAGDVRGGISMRLNMGLFLSRMNEPGAIDDAIGWLSDAASYAMDAGDEYAELRSQAEEAIRPLSGSTYPAGNEWAAEPALDYPDDRYAPDYRADRDDTDRGRAGAYGDDREDPSGVDNRYARPYDDGGDDDYDEADGHPDDHDDRPWTASYREATTRSNGAGTTQDRYAPDTRYADGASDYDDGEYADDRWYAEGPGREPQRSDRSFDSDPGPLPYRDDPGNNGFDYDDHRLAYPDTADRYRMDRYDGGDLGATEDTDWDRQPERQASERPARRSSGRRGSSSRSLDDDPSEPDGNHQVAGRSESGPRWSLRDRLAWQRPRPETTYQTDSFDVDRDGYSG
jgi:tetratricopeptide (TPR) repeat protein